MRKDVSLEWDPQGQTSFEMGKRTYHGTSSGCLRRQSTLLAMQMLREQDYDFGVTYYPGKANGVAGDLSRSVPQKVTMLRLVIQES